jgi:hypothetical protein
MKIKSIAKIVAVGAFVASVSLMSNKAMALMTGVYVNGQELSSTAVAQLEQCRIPVRAGNYWMDAQGTFGYIGGPALGNVVVACQQASSGGPDHYSDISGGGGLVCDGGSCVGW